jgi:hypothetical protein
MDSTALKTRNFPGRDTYREVGGDKKLVDEAAARAREFIKEILGSEPAHR